MKNGFFLLIDALRYDVVANAAAFRLLAPNLFRVAEKGLTCKVVTNAQATQFVMPALFTGTYPLDFGGYNDGIRDRPISFVELLRDSGRETFLMATANQLGLSLGYQRGFDVLATTSDYRTQVEYRISRTIGHEIAKYRRGEIDVPTAVEQIRSLMMPLLDGLIEAIASHDRTIWPQGLERLNRRIAEGCKREKQLLVERPELVLAKLLRVAPGLYWHYLGAERVGGLTFFWKRLISAVNWRSREKLAAQTLFPFLLLQHYQAIAGDVMPAIARFISESRARPWFVHMHLMDLHDCRAANRFGHVLSLVRYLPRWLKARRLGLSRRRLLYDAALMYVDDQVAGVLKQLQPSIDAGETVLLITGDHGSQYAESPRPKPSIGERMFYEHIEVPMILAGAGQAGPTGMIDSMGVMDSFLTALDVPRHSAFKGVGAQQGGRDAVVTESGGPGYVDVKNGDLYFAVTTTSHRLFLKLQGSVLTATRLYDHRNDSRELRNIVTLQSEAPVIGALCRILFREREALLRDRGVNSESDVVIAGRDDAAAA